MMAVRAVSAVSGGTLASRSPLSTDATISEVGTVLGANAKFIPLDRVDFSWSERVLEERLTTHFSVREWGAPRGALCLSRSMCLPLCLRAILCMHFVGVL